MRLFTIRSTTFSIQLGHTSELGRAPRLYVAFRNRNEDAESSLLRAEAGRCFSIQAGRFTTAISKCEADFFEGESKKEEI